MPLRPTILIAEDDQLLRLVLADHLQDVGFNVIEATNVLHAIGLLGRHSIDALITDVDMPGSLNGLDLASLVAGCRPNALIIVASGRSVAPSEIPVGALFVPKPYSLDKLSSFIAEGLSIGVASGITSKAAAS